MKKGIVVLGVMLLLMLGAIGCEQAIRFAPGESIKQTAELTHQLANKINQEGTDAESPASEKLVKGTLVSLSYTGRPKEPPNPEDFDTITQQGQDEALKRPDPWRVADHLIELAIGVITVSGVGGAGAVKIVSALKKAKEKSVALKEIIKGNEIFKDEAAPDAKEAFGKAQNLAQISNGTRRVVAETKLS